MREITSNAAMALCILQGHQGIIAKNYGDSPDLSFLLLHWFTHAVPSSHTFSAFFKQQAKQGTQYFLLLSLCSSSFWGIPRSSWKRLQTQTLGFAIKFVFLSVAGVLTPRLFLHQFSMLPQFPCIPGCVHLFPVWLEKGCHLDIQSLRIILIGYLNYLNWLMMLK